MNGCKTHCRGLVRKITLIFKRGAKLEGVYFPGAYDRAPDYVAPQIQRSTLFILVFMNVIYRSHGSVGVIENPVPVKARHFESCKLSGTRSAQVVWRKFTDPEMVQISQDRS